MTSEELVDGVARGVIKILSPKKICGLLKISRSTFDRWVNKGQFPRAEFRFGSTPRWTEIALKKYLENQLQKKGKQ